MASNSAALNLTTAAAPPSSLHVPGWATAQARLDLLRHRHWWITPAVVFIVVMPGELAALIGFQLASVRKDFAGPLAAGVTGLLVLLLVLLAGIVQHRRTYAWSASPRSIAALRRRIPPRIWARVAAKAEHWLRRPPGPPMTINLVLGWIDDAAAEEKASLPRTIAEAAAARTQARAFGW